MAKNKQKSQGAASEKRVSANRSSVAAGLSKADLGEYVTYLRSTRRVIGVNILAGMSRGFGFVVGATLVVTIVTLIISHLSGIPIIGNFFVWMQESLGGRQFTP